MWLSFLTAEWLNWVSRQGSCQEVWCIIFSWGRLRGYVICPIFKLRSECHTQPLPGEPSELDKVAYAACQLSGNVTWDLSLCHIVSDSQTSRSNLVSTPGPYAELAEPTQANARGSAIHSSSCWRLCPVLANSANRRDQPSSKLSSCSHCVGRYLQQRLKKTHLGKGGGEQNESFWKKISAWHSGLAQHSWWSGLCNNLESVANVSLLSQCRVFQTSWPVLLSPISLCICAHTKTKMWWLFWINTILGERGWCSANTCREIS